MSKNMKNRAVNALNTTLASGFILFGVVYALHSINTPLAGPSIIGGIAISAAGVMLLASLQWTKRPVQRSKRGMRVNLAP